MHVLLLSVKQKSAPTNDTLKQWDRSTLYIISSGIWSYKWVTRRAVR